MLLKERIIDKVNFNKRMRVLSYVDKSLGDFFKKAKSSQYFNETLFVLTADHPHSMGLKWSSKEYYQRNKIPLFFYSPELLKTPNIVNNNFGSHMDIPPTLISMISENTSKMHTWGRSLLENPKIKLLTSHFFDCLNNLCITNEPTFNNSIFVLQKNEELTLCKDDLCSKRSDQLKIITEAFQNSGINYLFNYQVE